MPRGGPDCPLIGAAKRQEEITPFACSTSCVLETPRAFGTPTASYRCHPAKHADPNLPPRRVSWGSLARTRVHHRRRCTGVAVGRGHYRGRRRHNRRRAGVVLPAPHAFTPTAAGRAAYKHRRRRQNPKLLHFSNLPSKPLRSILRCNRSPRHNCQSGASPAACETSQPPRTGATQPKGVDGLRNSTPGFVMCKCNVVFFWLHRSDNIFQRYFAHGVDLRILTSALRVPHPTRMLDARFDRPQ